MLETNDFSSNVPNEAGRLSGPAFTHPDEVLQCCSLSVADKRSLLAAWASDAHAVPNRPAMRRLDSGAIVDIDTVLTALRALDQSNEEAGQHDVRRGSLERSGPAPISRWRRPLRRNGRDDDDDPPPSPAAALPPGVELELRRRRDAAWTLAAA